MRNIMHPQTYFARMPQPKIERSRFDLSENLITTMDVNQIQPIYLKPVLPGDTWSMNARFHGRLNTPEVPFMDNLRIDIHAFFVPNRLVDVHWVNIMGEQEDPEADPQPVYTVPQMELDLPITPGSLPACFALPLTNTPLVNTTVSAYPFRGYRKNYDDWYRDQNFQKKTLTNISSANDKLSEGYGALFKRWKVRDYFTGALPWTQKGDPVEIPSLTNVTAELTGSLSTPTGLGGFRNVANNSVQTVRTIASGSPPTLYGENNNLQIGVRVDPMTIDYSSLNVDVTATGTGTINDLRLAITLQQFLEKDATYGTRYIEYIYAHFGVINPDFRLQRPEFLGSTSVDVNITPIAQTSATTDDGTPQANLAAMGTVSGAPLKFMKTFTEHGYVHIYASVVADLHYQQGIERHWFNETRFDFYDPIFANIGEQAILNRELTITDDPETDEAVFGYQEAWAHERYSPSKITNIMNSNAPLTLDVWHLAEDYSTTPVLGPTFLTYNTPIDRVITQTDQPAFKFNAWFNCWAARPMPVRSRPGLRRL